jgi:ATP-dependent DNA helicase DinG
MHARALESDLLIVNHHLFFADLALRENDFASVLPSYDAVIFDEAHEVEEIAGNYFGRSISNFRFEELCRDAETMLRRLDRAAISLLRALQQLLDRTQRFCAVFPATEGRFGFDNREQFLEEYFDEYAALQNSLMRLDGELNTMEEKPEEVHALLRRLGEMRGDLTFLMESRDRQFVYWYERRSRGLFLQATPIDVSQILTERLFEQIDTVVLTSATLAVGGSFEFVRSRLGIRSAREELLEPHFDYPKQALLYIPQALPDPTEPEFAAAAAEEIIRLLELSHGRAFVLFTSFQQMRQIYERVRTEVRYPLLLQGTAPKRALLEQFQSSGGRSKTSGAVLFATKSFWQGVDVPGSQLSCVIIDRLPFAVPSDPVVRARVENIREAGGNPFYEYQVPDAVITLKQGLGRLIRSGSDRGVLAVLDTRLVRRQYGQMFFQSLPPYRTTRSLADVEEFFSHLSEPGA